MRRRVYARLTKKARGVHRAITHVGFNGATFPAMNANDSSPTAATSTVVTSVPQINVFNWLLVLGFPADIAAAVAQPDTFAR